MGIQESHRRQYTCDTEGCTAYGDSEQNEACYKDFRCIEIDSGIGSNARNVVYRAVLCTKHARELDLRCIELGFKGIQKSIE